MGQTGSNSRFDAEMDWLSDMDEPKARLRDFLPHALAGAALVCSFALAGTWLGQASAHNGPGNLAEIVKPDSMRGSLAKASVGDLDVVFNPTPRQQQVMSSAKSDMITTDFLRPRVLQASYRPADPVQDAKARRAMPLSIARLEENAEGARLAKNEGSLRRRQMANEQACLARAVYFEARSESEMGQIAVAQVILNRVKDPSYPNTICGVVYQGADAGTSACQFSFACDGLSDEPKNRNQWQASQRVAQKVLSGKAADQVKVVEAATHYHADYVQPKWSFSLRRVIKIGRHIFYSDS